MGAVISSCDKLVENDLLKRWTGLEPITDNDPFWNQLLSFNYQLPDNRLGAQEMEESVSDVCEALMYNSPTTGNFAAFVRVFLRRAGELKTSAQCHDKIFLWQTSNALLILRICCKYFADRMQPDDFLQLFSKKILYHDGKLETRSDNEEPFENPAEELLNAILEIILELPVNELTSCVHLEALNWTLVILSAQLFHDKPLQQSVWLGYLMSGKCSSNGHLLIEKLLSNYLSDTPASGDSRPGAFEHGGSFVLGFAASMMSALSWTYGGGSSEEGPSPPPTVRSQSLLLALVLVSQWSSANNPAPNPYRQALFSFSNSQEKANLTSPGGSVASFKFDYGRLYESLASHVSDECSLLLLYLLLHQNLGFRNYVLSRVNIDTLVVPVLRILYEDTAGTTGHHLYLALVIILILTEDDFFCKIIHETTLKDVDWYRERQFTDVTLGGLIILVLVKSIQINIVKVRDRYLHTNCLAALANMSGCFKQLHPFVAQRLVGLLELLSRRHTRAVEHLRLSVELDLTNAEPQTSSISMKDDVGALEEGIRMLLEIVNCCLSKALHQNPHLIYTLLYKRALFDSFKQHPSFQDILQNIEQVLNHFAHRVKSVDKSASVSQLLEVICKGAMQWPPDRLKKFPDLKFRYIEDENTEEFFVPYAWTLVYKHSGFYWDPTRVKLFSAANITHFPN